MSVFGKILYILKKTFGFFVFGLGGPIIREKIRPPNPKTKKPKVFFNICPLLFLFIKPIENANRKIRLLVSSSFLTYISFLKKIGIISFQYREIENLNRLDGMIVCANHPTLLDAVFLIGLVPNADCIVKSSHWKNPILKSVVSRLYISNSLHGIEIIEACRNSISKGNNIIIFPEGTRTDPNSESVKFQRSAAQIALRTNNNILPVFINVTKHSGLGKGDSFFTHPYKGLINFEITFRKPVLVSEYREFSHPIGARRLTDDIKTAIFL